MSYMMYCKQCGRAWPMDVYDGCPYCGYHPATCLCEGCEADRIREAKDAGYFKENS